MRKYIVIILLIFLGYFLYTSIGQKIISNYKLRKFGIGLYSKIYVVDGWVKPDGTVSKSNGILNLPAITSDRLLASNVSISKDSKYGAFVTRDEKNRSYDVPPNPKLLFFNNQGIIKEFDVRYKDPSRHTSDFDVDISQNSTRIAVASFNNIQVFDVTNGKSQLFDISPIENKICNSREMRAEDCYAFIFSVMYRAMYWQGNNTLLFKLMSINLGYWDDIYMLNIQSGEIKKLEGIDNVLLFQPLDNNRIAYLKGVNGTKNGTVIIKDISTQKIINSFPDKAGGAGLDSLVASPDGKYLLLIEKECSSIAIFNFYCPIPGSLHIDIVDVNSGSRATLLKDYPFLITGLKNISYGDEVYWIEE